MLRILLALFILSVTASKEAFLGGSEEVLPTGILAQKVPTYKIDLS
jgi:hypothetical protein